MHLPARVGRSTMLAQACHWSYLATDTSVADSRNVLTGLGNFSVRSEARGNPVFAGSHSFSPRPRCWEYTRTRDDGEGLNPPPRDR